MVGVVDVALLIIPLAGRRGHRKESQLFSFNFSAHHTSASGCLAYLCPVQKDLISQKFFQSPYLQKIVEISLVAFE